MCVHSHPTWPLHGWLYRSASVFWKLSFSLAFSTLFSEISSLRAYPLVFHGFDLSNADESQIHTASSTVSASPTDHFNSNHQILSCECLEDRMSISLYQVYRRCFSTHSRINEWKTCKPLECNKLHKWTHCISPQTCSMLTISITVQSSIHLIIT